MFGNAMQACLALDLPPCRIMLPPGFSDAKSWGSLYAGVGHFMEHVSHILFRTRPG